MEIRIGKKNVPPKIKEEKDKNQLKSNLKIGMKHKNDKSINESKSKEVIVNELFNELESLIGLNKVKKLIKEIYAFVEIQKKRKELGLVIDPLVLHMIFKGNPGTGKTTVARLIGHLFKEIGVLTKGHMIEVERADLVGEYIGHTAQKTRDQLKKSLGGILFIDEAYSLARGGEKDFGKEAIDTLVKLMEDNKDDLILILAGYKDEMTWFMKTNPGLKSRFPIHIDFPDYNIEELILIGERMLKTKEYLLTCEAKNELIRILHKQTGVGNEYSGNARLVRNLIERSIRKQALRLYSKTHLDREDLITIIRDDLIEEKPPEVNVKNSPTKVYTNLQ